ncbi:MAG: hypothetical protein OEU86_04120, partial [Gammaproteobacteria bacterium]|nr:hypothetical protein [Gammaproteobacteria bacterium]
QIIDFDDLPLVAMGAITEKSIENRTAQILGQDIFFDDFTLVISTEIGSNNLIATNGISALEKINPNDYVIIAGELMEEGKSLATTIIVLSEQYETSNSVAYLRALFSTKSNGSVTSGATVVEQGLALDNQDLTKTKRNTAAEYIGFTVDGESNKLYATYGSLLP